MKAFWLYYRTVNILNLLFCTIAAFGLSKLYYLPILFCTVGIPVGILGYNSFFKNQYYLYQNLGYTKLKLATLVFAMNIVFALPVFLTLLFQ